MNKAQGQTPKRVAIYTPLSGFSHGQLYLACSRSSSFDNVAVAIFEGHRHRVENDRLISQTLYIEKWLKFQIYKYVFIKYVTVSTCELFSRIQLVNKKFFTKIEVHIQ